MNSVTSSNSTISGSRLANAKCSLKFLLPSVARTSDIGNVIGNYAFKQNNSGRLI
ncbi:hypothetical protein KAU09_05595 [Candidatus Parcubacteria bacterium]|nr:hypothetical protein [Candidatus Parcubacteria bacterium]